MKIFNEINRLLDYAQRKLCLKTEDVNYVRNNVLGILNLDTFKQTEDKWDGCEVDELLAEFVNACVSEKVFHSEDASYYCDKIMGALSLAPSALTSKFNEISVSVGTRQATDFLYMTIAWLTIMSKSAFWTKTPVSKGTD